LKECSGGWNTFVYGGRDRFLLSLAWISVIIKSKRKFIIKSLNSNSGNQSRQRESNMSVNNTKAKAFLLDLEAKYLVRQEFREKIFPLVEKIFHKELSIRQQELLAEIVEEIFEKESQIASDLLEAQEIINQIQSYARENYTELVKLRDTLLSLKQGIQRVRLMRSTPEKALYH